MSAINSPAPADESVVLSPAWLSGILDQRYPGAVVTDTRVVERLETVATKVRFRVGYSRPAGAPAGLCAKGYFDPARRRATRTEVDFYRNVAPQLPVRTPPCVHAAVDEDSGHPLILMHDLTDVGARFLDPLVGYSAEQATATLDQLAALHAATSDGKHPGLARLFPPRLVSLSKHLTPDQLQQQLDDGRAHGISERVRRADRLIAAMSAMERLGAGTPACLVHGDLHTGNIYELPDGQPGLIDWQVVQYGSWALDVAYHLATVLDPADLAAGERDLLDYYLARLSALGVAAPDRDRAWTMYRASLPYGFFLWSITRAVDRPVVEHLAGRLGRAVERHRSLELLDV